MSDVPTFELAGAELAWPIGSAAGMANYPDIEGVASRFDALTATGLGFVVLGSWKLGGESGGNGYVQTGSGWEHRHVDEHVDVGAGAGYNAKRLPGPGTDHGMPRLPDFVDLAQSRGVEVGLSFSPHTHEPLEELREIFELGRKALAAGILYVEIDLSCPNVPGRLPFYQDLEAVGQFYDMAKDQGPLLNRYGHPGIYPKYGPGVSVPEIDATMRHSAGSHSIGGRVTSNTLGNQKPRLPDGRLAVHVNGGKAGQSGPTLAWVGRDELIKVRLAQGAMSGDNTEELISVLGVSTGREVKQRLDMGARAVQLGSVLYWPELIGCETPAEAVDQIKGEFVDAMTT